MEPELDFAALFTVLSDHLSELVSEKCTDYVNFFSVIMPTVCDVHQQVAHNPRSDGYAFRRPAYARCDKPFEAIRPCGS
jgi:hypothetical protein